MNPFLLVLEFLSNVAVAFLVLFGLVHFALGFYLVRWRTREVHRLSNFLKDIARGIAHRPEDDPDADIDDRIQGFLSDVRRVLDHGGDPEERKRVQERFAERLRTKDERRPYLQVKGLESHYNVARTAIEAYPFLGILGTVLALAVGLAEPPSTPSHVAQSTLAVPSSAPGKVTLPSGVGATVPRGAQGDDPAAVLANLDAPSASVSSMRVTRLITEFSRAIYVTGLGLVLAVVFMLIHAWFEPDFQRLFEFRAAVRDVIRTADLELIRASATGGEAEPVESPSRQVGA